MMEWTGRVHAPSEKDAWEDALKLGTIIVLVKMLPIMLALLTIVWPP